MASERWRPVPPLYFLAAVLVMVAFHARLPLARVVPAPYNALGIVLMVGGVGFGIWGAVLFLRRRTTVRPFVQSTRLVTDGPYRISRNPMYTGLTAALAGVALLLGTLSPWLVVPVFVWLIQNFVIKVEEAMLADTFGPEYDAYRSRVRRWL